MSARAVVALGTNLGDRAAALDSAVGALSSLGELIGISAWYESIAHTVTGLDTQRPRYLNGVIILETELSAELLLSRLHQIEAEHGRVRGEQWADRTLDLDLIDYAGESMTSSTLTVPHPRATERAFVLGPWLEIDPTARLADHGPIAELYAALPEPERAAMSVWGPRS